MNETSYRNSLFSIALLVLAMLTSAARAQSVQLIVETEDSQTESVIARLKTNPEVEQVQRMFGSGLLVVTTSRTDVLDESQVGKVHLDQVLETASTSHWTSTKENFVESAASHSKAQPSLFQNTAPTPPTGDPLNTFQWSYQNLGYERGRSAPGLAGMDTGVHAVTGEGAGVTVAIVTTGADDTHEDLAGALWTNSLEIPRNDIDDDNNGYVDDVHGPGPLGSGDTFDLFGNGTALAGIIAARKDNGLGIAGIAPQAKVLACNAAVPTGQISVADLLRCIDYVIYQKTVRNENIPVFVFSIRGFRPFDQVIEPALRALMDADIIVVAPNFIESPGYGGLNIDRSTDYPSTADFPNIISVNAIDQSGFNPYKSWGRRTLDVSAPGREILTTLPGYTESQDSSSFFYEDMDTVPPGWTLTGGWEHSATVGYGGSGAFQLRIGVGDVFDDSQIVELPSIDLSALPGPRPWFSFKLWAEDMIGEGTNDFEGDVELEIYQGPARGWWPFETNNDHLAGPAWQSISGAPTDFQLSGVDITDVRLRFRAKLHDQHSPNIIIDDLGIGAEPPNPGYSNVYGFYFGTAPAAAIVGAMVAVVKSERPELSNIEIQNLVVGSGPSISEVSGGNGSVTPPIPENRIASLWTTDNRGSLQCSGLLTQRRTVPTENLTYVRALGQPLNIKAISIDCQNAGQAPLVSTTSGGNSVMLSDSGMTPDSRAGDGEFAGQWVSAVPANEDLNFTNDVENTQVLALRDYSFSKVPFQWRNVSERSNDSDPSFIDPPFPLLIGDLPEGSGISPPIVIRYGSGIHFPILFGGLNVWDDTIPGSPATLRTNPESLGWKGQFRILGLFSRHRILAPIIGAHIPDMEVQGQAPNREWILQWKNFSYSDCEDENLSVQYVFFERSPDILLNYRDVAEDCSGQLPRLLVQYNTDSWVTYEQDLEPTTSIMLSPDGRPNVAPSLTQPIPAQVLVHGQEFELNLTPYFDDADGDELSYFLGKNQEFVNIEPGGLLTARFGMFPETDIPVRTIEVGAYDGRQSTRAAFDVSFDNTQNDAPVQTGSTADFRVQQDVLMSIAVGENFQDPDADPLQFYDVNDPNSTNVVNRDGRIVVNTNGRTIGEQITVDFLVSDGVESIQSSAIFTVVAGNSQPPQLISAIPDITVRVGEYARVPLYKHFEQANSSGGISYLQLQHPGSSKINGIPPVWHAVFTEEDRLSGDSEVVIRATSPGIPGETLESFQVTITPENQPPVFTISMPISVGIGAAVSIDLNTIVSDPDGDQLYFLVGELPAGLRLDSAIQISGALMASGQYGIPLRVTDRIGASLNSSIRLNVSQPTPPPTPPPAPPVASGGGGSTSQAMILLWLSLYCMGWTRRRCIRH